MEIERDPFLPSTYRIVKFDVPEMLDVLRHLLELAQAAKRHEKRWLRLHVSDPVAAARARERCLEARRALLDGTLALIQEGDDKCDLCCEGCGGLATYRNAYGRSTCVACRAVVGPESADDLGLDAARHQDEEAQHG